MAGGGLRMPSRLSKTGLTAEDHYSISTGCLQRLVIFLLDVIVKSFESQSLSLASLSRSKQSRRYTMIKFSLCECYQNRMQLIMVVACSSSSSVGDTQHDSLLPPRLAMMIWGKDESQGSQKSHSLYAYHNHVVHHQKSILVSVSFVEGSAIVNRSPGFRSRSG